MRNKAIITVKEVATRLGVSEQTVRLALQQGLYSFGVAVKTSSKYTYVINREQFEREWGND